MNSLSGFPSAQEPVIVLLLRAKNIPNCSFYDKSMKLGRITNLCEINIS